MRGAKTLFESLMSSSLLVTQDQSTGRLTIMKDSRVFHDKFAANLSASFLPFSLIYAGHSLQSFSPDALPAFALYLQGAGALGLLAVQACLLRAAVRK